MGGENVRAGFFGHQIPHLVERLRVGQLVARRGAMAHRRTFTLVEFKNERGKRLLTIWSGWHLKKTKKESIGLQRKGKWFGLCYVWFRLSRPEKAVRAIKWTVLGPQSYLQTCAYDGTGWIDGCRPITVNMIFLGNRLNFYFLPNIVPPLRPPPLLLLVHFSSFLSYFSLRFYLTFFVFYILNLFLNFFSLKHWFTCAYTHGKNDT